MKTLFQNENLLVFDKPAGVEVHDFIKRAARSFPQLKKLEEKRYGLVHRLDKDTSGILLAAGNEDSLKFLQQQFKERKVVKKYLALIVGNLDYEKSINALVGRDLKNRRKQKAYLPHSPEARHEGMREAKTEIRPVKEFENYTLIEATPKTGRKHQIRCHLAFIDHPIAGDELYGFKDQPRPEGLSRQFLHAYYLKIKTPNNKVKEFTHTPFSSSKKENVIIYENGVGFKSELPSDLRLKLFEKSFTKTKQKIKHYN